MKTMTMKSITTKTVKTKTMTQFQIEPIGIIHSPFKQKFAIPRQPGLNSIQSSIEILTPYDTNEAFTGIEQFSHLWLSFIFHENIDKSWSPQVRPPRLGGNKKMGVFATRSSFRPNSIGLSVVKFRGLRQKGDKIYLDIEGADLVDQTPVVDIKPYIPYADSIPEAQSGYAQQTPENKLKVVFDDRAESQLEILEPNYPDLGRLISEVLSQDPRPAYKKLRNDAKIYAVKLYEFDVQWQVNNNTCHIVDILSLNA